MRSARSARSDRRAVPRRPLDAHRRGGRARSSHARRRCHTPYRLVEATELPIRIGDDAAAQVPRAQHALDAYLATVKRFVVRAASVGRTEPQEPTTWPHRSTACSSRSTCRTIRWPPATPSAACSRSSCRESSTARDPRRGQPPAGRAPPPRARGTPAGRRRHATGAALGHRLPPQLGRCERQGSRASLRCCSRFRLRGAGATPTGDADGRAARRRDVLAGPSASGDPAARRRRPPTRTGRRTRSRRGTACRASRGRSQTSSRQLQAWNADRYPSLATNPGIIEPDGS